MSRSITRIALGAAGLAATAALVPAGIGAAAYAGSTDPVGAVTGTVTSAADHAYRHGLEPTLDAAKHLGIGLPGLKMQLSYGGGTGGIGVVTGAPKVYLVFWGSQWGTAGTDANNYTTFTGDPGNAAPKVQAFFKGLGTNNEGWSRVMTQYCEGVASGSKTCTASAPHVAYPASTGALAGVWYDSTAPAPSAATQAQLGQEAVNAAAHFNNTTASANRNAMYEILSPTGTHPDGFNQSGTTWCAWHDYTGDVGVSSPYGNLAFANDPYQLDQGANCGENFVNAGSAGVDDGFTIVFGHEYAETMTDELPAGGWTDIQGQENADKCAWISSGQGAATNLVLSTGTFAVQGTWANDFNGGKGGCETTHA
jgi:serine protease